MKTVGTLEETLNGNYGTVYQEVVTEDRYRLKLLDFVPDIVFDIGANVGVFTHYARSLFPAATIVAVEPHPENIVHFKKFTDDSDAILIEAALGRGNKIYRVLGADFGDQECYLSEGLGYPAREVSKSAQYTLTDVRVVSLGDILYPFPMLGQTTLLKVDCEGGENCLWQDPAAMELIRKMDYICVELHYLSCLGEHTEAVRLVTDEALKSLEKTHDCRIESIYFLARKKKQII